MKPSDLDWHVLFGPLPVQAVPSRQPVASPEVLASPTGWAVAGWEQITLHLFAGPAGSRTSLVVLDASGTLLSASDLVLYRKGLDGGPPPESSDAPCLIQQDSVGGRFEPDGSFRGTRWRSIAQDPGGVDELEWEMVRSEPSSAPPLDSPGPHRNILSMLVANAVSVPANVWHRSSSENSVRQCIVGPRRHSSGLALQRTTPARVGRAEYTASGS